MNRCPLRIGEFAFATLLYVLVAVAIIWLAR